MLDILFYWFPLSVGVCVVIETLITVNAGKPENTPKGPFLVRVGIIILMLLIMWAYKQLGN